MSLENTAELVLKKTRQLDLSHSFVGQTSIPQDTQLHIQVEITAGRHKITAVYEPGQPVSFINYSKISPFDFQEIVKRAVSPCMCQIRHFLDTDVLSKQGEDDSTT